MKMKLDDIFGKSEKVSGKGEKAATQQPQWGTALHSLSKFLILSDYATVLTLFMALFCVCESPTPRDSSTTPVYK